MTFKACRFARHRGRVRRGLEGRQFEHLETRRLLAVVNNNLAVGDELFTYRIAVAATAEYTALVGGTDAALQSIQQLVDNLNDVYERELSIRLELVSGTNLIFTNAATDGYTNGAPGTMLGENQTKLDAVIGTAGYDLGHVLGTVTAGASGVASLGVVGRPNLKARGASAVSSDASNWLDLVAHEIGHQFAAEHTFNGIDGNCGSQRSPSSAYEPGSGSTTMSYFGICGSDNLPAPEAFVFHADSFEDIHTYIADEAFAQPFSITPLANQVPQVSAEPVYVVPARTPFQLTAIGTDDDPNDVLTYSWEQLDLGGAQSIGTGWTDNGNSPLFRAYPPTINPSRTFPRMSDLLANVDTAPLGELLPSTTRSLNFRVTVRDANGGVNSDDVRLDVVNTSVPFRVSSPNSAVTWTGGSQEIVTWDVAGTNANGINAAQVEIYLSTDGGQTFPTLIATTANDGSESIVVPNVDTAAARLMIKGAGNVFFDLSDNDFAINANPAAAGLTVTPGQDWGELAEGQAARTYAVQLNTMPSDDVTIEVMADAETEVSLDGISFAASQRAVLGSTAPRTIFARAITDQQVEGPWLSTLTHTVVESLSPEYPVGLPGQSLTAYITDQQSPPVVGVDFDAPATSSFQMSPPGWLGSHLGETGNSPFVYTNLFRDDGLPTPYDLTVDFSAVVSGTGWTTADASAFSKPMHIPSLTAIGASNNLPFALPLTATWSDLTPGRSYGVYVLGLHSRDNAFSQTVTISGAPGSSVSFTQDLPPDILLVNDEPGDSNRTLESFEDVVVADATGKITITVDAVDTEISLGGLALREMPISNAQVVARHVFYNNSAFDGNDPTVNAADDAAIATDKSVLQSGTATIDHYSNYHHGINGLLVDIAGLTGPLSAADFEFRVGTDSDLSTWDSNVPVPSVTVRPAAGAGGTDRVALTWSDGQLVNTWLEVTIQANANTNLASPDVFYFGNLIGETGNSPRASVDFADLQRAYPHLFAPAAIQSRFDVDRDQQVTFNDLQQIVSNSLQSLPLIQVPAATAFGANATQAGPTLSAPTVIDRVLGDEVFDPLANELTEDGRQPLERPTDIVDQWIPRPERTGLPAAVAWVA